MSHDTGELAEDGDWSLPEHMLKEKGERPTGRDSIMACLFETVLGWVALPELPTESGKEATK